MDASIAGAHARTAGPSSLVSFLMVSFLLEEETTAPSTHASRLSRFHAEKFFHCRKCSCAACLFGLENNKSTSQTFHICHLKTKMPAMNHFASRFSVMETIKSRFPGRAETACPYIGSNSTSPPNDPGWADSAFHNAAAPMECPIPIITFPGFEFSRIFLTALETAVELQLTQELPGWATRGLFSSPFS